QAPAPPPEVTTSTTQDPPKAAAPPPPVVKADPPKADPPKIVPVVVIAKEPFRPLPPIIARGKIDPFDLSNEMKTGGSPTSNVSGNATAAPPTPQAVTDLLTRGDAEFNQKHYSEARLLYEQAFKADAKAGSDEIRGRWAYCQLQMVVNQVNRFPEQPCDWAKLEADVRTAVKVAPHLANFGDWLVGEMNKRRSAAPPGAAVVAPVVATVKHSPRGTHGYAVAETANFRVFHNQSQ